MGMIVIMMMVIKSIISFNSRVLIVKLGVVINVPEPNGTTSTVIPHPFLLKMVQKYLLRQDPKGSPWQHHQIDQNTGCQTQIGFS